MIMSTILPENLQEKTDLASNKERILLIGNGMVGCQFCIDFLAKGLNHKFELTVFGKEAKPAYDRVKLTDYAREQKLSKITLKDLTWYKKNNIKIHVDEAVISIDRETKTLTTSKDNTYTYDRLVFATGSKPFVPPIPGKENDGVFVYRTCKDVDQIIDYSKKSRVAIVIGGGLLGLEAANFIKDLGLDTHIIEQADYLMPRQLDHEGSNLFKDIIERKGYELHLGTLVKEIHKLPNGSLSVELSNGDNISTDIVIFSAGVRSNSDLAKDAGLNCSPSQGIIVNDELSTSEPNIYAIGECVNHRGNLYGLVLPGYKMAKVLVERLLGLDSHFYGADMSTRLKMLGVDVISLGDALQPYKSIEYKSGNIYRKITHKDGEIVGAIGVGEWLQAGQIQTAISNRMPLNEKEKRRFLKTGTLWAEREDVKKWPDDAIICNCMRVSKGDLICCMNEQGAKTVEALAEKTGASTVCGSCVPLLENLCGEEVTERRKPEKMLILVSMLTLAAVLTIIFMPTIIGGDSYNGDDFQRTKFITDFQTRQITGFTILGFTVLAALLSARKRILKFRIGSYPIWRILHGFFGLFSMITLMLHTGFSAGTNLNFMLFTTFTFINFLGFLTGMASAFEFFGLNKVEAFCRKWRPQITFLHILAFWPLPVLLTFHIIQAYYF